MNFKIYPKDLYNQTLLEQVHPDTWENPIPKPKYNLVVIGAGPAGLVVASGAAGLGAKVALIEKNLLGGDCLNVGCVPSKTLIKSARIIGEIRNSGKFGIGISEPIKIDFAAIMERMRRIRADLSHHDSASRYQYQLGVDIFLGEGKFITPHQIQVGNQILHFNKAVIATGTKPAKSEIPGLEETEYLTNETIFNLTQLPARLAIIGAGPIGCELAQTFRRFGSKVTLIHKHQQILTKEDPQAAQIIQKQFQTEGINILLNTNITQIEKATEGKVIYYQTQETKSVITVDEILLATGRTPNIDGLNLESVGVKYDLKKGILVNDYLQTTTPNIYAAGDICLPQKFTHVADFAARIVIQNSLFLGRKKVSNLTIPWCTYTDPEVAQVGITAEIAHQKKIAIDTYCIPFTQVDRAKTDSEEEGFVKIYTKKGTDQILGATIVASHAGDLISEITLAIVGNIGLKTIATTIHPYPTLAEAIRKAADAYNKTRLTPFIKNLFNGWLSWRL